MKNKIKHLMVLDWIGAFLSFTCAVHCLVFPFLLIFLPWLGMSFLLDRKVEYLFIGGSMTLATLSFCSGYHIHRKVRLLLILYICTGLIVAGKLWIGDPMGLWLAVPGALGLATGHLLNRKLCQHCSNCQHIEYESELLSEGEI
jgi:hypothetical protein